jgi:hypothetical protein
MIELYEQKTEALTHEDLVEIQNELALLHELMADHLLTCETCGTTKKSANSKRVRRRDKSA